MKIRKSLLSLAVVAALGPLTAQAGIVEPFNLRDGITTLVAGANSLDWNEQGSGVAIGVGPFGGNTTVIPVGTQFTFKYQANLVTAGGGVISPAFVTGLDTTSNGVADPGTVFEYTIVANFREVVVSSGIIGSTAVANFGLINDPANKVAIYYDTARNANTANGTGFDDGLKIAQFTIDTGEPGFDTFSTFSATSATAGQGSAKVHAALSGAGDFVNPLYLQGLIASIFDIEFESNLNVPAGTSTTTAFHVGGDALFPTYNVAANDILFKVDGANTFTFQAVPEPGTLALLGISLLGIAASRRRVKS